MLGHYMGRVWHFAFARFVIRTDAMQVIAAAAVPMLSARFLHVASSDLTAQVFSGIGYFSVSLLAIRLICAPYHVWKEERVRADSLKVILDSPEQKIAEKLADRRAQVLAEISRAVSEIVSHFGTGGAGKLDGKDAHNILSLMFEAGFHKELVAALNDLHVAISADSSDKALHYTNLKIKAAAVLGVIHRQV